MKKLSLAAAFVEKMTSRKERNPRARRPQTRALRLESLESRELLNVAPGGELLAAETADIRGYPTAVDVLDLSDATLDGVDGANFESSTLAAAPLIIVTTAEDVFDEYDGVISLREALEYAESGATITFGDSLKGKTLELDSDYGQLSTSKTLTIDATSLWDATDQTPGITLSGEQLSRILYLEEGTNVVINKITFADGYINGNYGSGGAIYNNKATLTLNSCEIRNNRAYYGAGVYSNNGETTLVNCTVTNNTASFGGGVYSSNGKTKFTSCTVTNNTAIGGGIYSANAEMTLVNCAITNNTSGNSGGGMYSAGGKTTLANCILANNITTQTNGASGGAIYNNNATLSLDNCVIYDNRAYYGGGVYSEKGKTTFANCTVTNNTAEYSEGYACGGGVFLRGTATFTAYNTIIASNNARLSGADVYRYDSNATANAYNTLSGYSAWTKGKNNLIYDVWKPLFTNAEAGDYTLTKNSYALNKGNNEYVTTSLDLVGNPRISGQTVDLGAYEYQLLKLATPTNPRETAKTEATISVAWDAVPDANGYQFSWKNTTDSTFTIVNLDAATTLYTLANLDNNAIYDWKVLALGDYVNYDDSDYTATRSVKPRQKLAAPTLSSSAEQTSITVSWDAVPNAVRYSVSYKLASASEWNEVDAETNLNYTISGLSPNTKYDVQVKAIGDDFDWSDSDDATLTVTTPKPNGLSTPANPRETAKTETTISVAWNAVTNASGFRLAWKNKTKSSFTYVTLGATKTSYTLTDLDNGATYEWKVQALGDGVNFADSAYTTTRSVAPRRELATPTASSSAKPSSITVSWNAVPNAVRYSFSYKLAGETEWNDVDVQTNLGYTISGLSPNTQYDVRIRSIGDDFNFTDSDYATLTVATSETETLSSPADPRETAKTETTISVAWDAVSNAGAYKFAWKNKTDSSFTVVNLDASKTSHMLSGLDEGATYEWKVLALGDGVNFADSAYTATRTFATRQKLDAPTLSFNAEPTSIAVSWNAVPNAARYSFSYRLASATEWKVVDAQTNLSFTISGLESSTQYDVQVKAIGDGFDYADSDYSTLTVTTAVPPDGESPVVSSVETRAVAAGDEQNELRIIFSEPVQLQALIDDGSIASVFQLTGGNNGVPISLDVSAFKYDSSTSTLVVSLAGFDDATIKDFAISVKDGVAATKLALLVDSSRVLDLAGNALRGSAASLGADAPDLVLFSEIVTETDASSAPSLYDWNGDGALDLVVGEKSTDGVGRVKVYLNQGATDALAYTDFFYATYWDASASCSVEIAVSGEIAPKIADITGDGFDDLIVGLADGTIALYRGAQLDGERVFSAPESVLVGAASAKKALDVGSDAGVEVFDWNGDGRNDLVVGATNGKIRVYLDASKTAGEYDFRSAATLAVGTSDLVVESGCSTPTIADVDGDGVFDLVSGNASGAMFVYRNAGTNASPKFEKPTPLLDASGETVTLGDATRSRPFAYDVNGDGVTDYLVGSSDGSVGYYEGVRLVAPNSEGTPGATFSCSISFPFALSNPDAPVYAAPTISRFGVADSGELVLLWLTADPAEKYAVEYRLQGAEEWTGSGLFTTLFGALPSANYGVGNVVQARVRAVASDVKGASDWSKVVQYKISGERPSISVATNVQEVGGVCAASVIVESNADAIGRWTIDWNDGSEPTSFVGLSMSWTLSHVYATSGVFTPILYLDDQEGVALDSITVEFGSAAKLDAAPVPLFAASPTTNAQLDAVFSQFAPELFVGPVMPDRALLARRELTSFSREAAKSLDRAFAAMTPDPDVFDPELENDPFADEFLADFFEETLK